MGQMEKQYHSAGHVSGISGEKKKSELLLDFKVKLLQRLSTPKMADILRSGIPIWGEIPPTVSHRPHLLWRIWTKVSKTEMTEGKTILKKSPNVPLYTASGTTNLTMFGILLNHRICQHSWFCTASKMYHLASF